VLLEIGFGLVAILFKINLIKFVGNIHCREFSGKYLFRQYTLDSTCYCSPNGRHNPRAER